MIINHLPLPASVGHVPTNAPSHQVTNHHTIIFIYKNILFSSTVSPKFRSTDPTGYPPLHYYPQPYCALVSQATHANSTTVQNSKIRLVLYNPRSLEFLGHHPAVHSLDPQNLTQPLPQKILSQSA